MTHIIETRVTRRRMLAACGALALLFAISTPGQGADGYTLAHLTFSQAVSLPGVVLPAGVYTFEAIRPDIVRVSSRDGQRVLYTGFTHRVAKPKGLGRDVLVSFGEARRGEPMPITRWYPELRAAGHAFIWR